MSRRHTHRPSRALAVLALAGALALTGCAADEPDTPSAGGVDTAGDGGTEVAGGDSAASCIAAVSYQDALYLQVDTGPVTRGEALDGAELPPCNDTGGTGDSEEQATPVEAFAVEGVDPRYAVLSEGPDGLWVYVAETHAPVLADAEPLPADVAAELGLD